LIFPILDPEGLFWPKKKPDAQILMLGHLQESARFCPFNALSRYCPFNALSRYCPFNALSRYCPFNALSRYCVFQGWASAKPLTTRLKDGKTSELDMTTKIEQISIFMSRWPT